MLASGQPPNPPQSILQLEVLERMGTELVRLCDSMEKHGLVDYQMGVWEEEILSSKQLALSSVATKPPQQKLTRIQSLHNALSSLKVRAMTTTLLGLK